MRFPLSFLIVGFALMTTLGPQTRASTYSASVSSGGGTIAFDANAGHLFATASGTVEPTPIRLNISGMGTAYAGFGKVGAFAQATTPGAPGLASDMLIRSIADATYDDFQVTAPNTTLTSVHTTLHFHVSGSVFTTAAPGGGAEASATVHIRIGGASDFGVLGTNSHDDNVNIRSAEGLFHGPADDRIAQGLNIDVTGDIPVGVFSIEMSIDAIAHANQNGAQPGIAAFANSIFSHTVSFASDGPVFDLPEGWTVNSVDANIVDNRWVDASVPEPSSFVLTTVGALSIVALRRKFRRA